MQLIHTYRLIPPPANLFCTFSCAWGHRQAPVARGGRSQKEIDEEIFRKPGLPEEQKDTREWVPETRTEDARPPQPLLLNFAQRANAVAVCGCLALAFGKGTADALETGLVPHEVAEVCTWNLRALVSVRCAVPGSCPPAFESAAKMTQMDERFVCLSKLLHDIFTKRAEGGPSCLSLLPLSVHLAH